MTVKELINRLSELNCPDYEVELYDNSKLDEKDIGFSKAGAKVVIGVCQEIKDLSDIISDLKDYIDDIENTLDDFSNTINDLEEILSDS